MKQIPLTQEKFAIVDDEDYERINQYKWYARKGGNTYYAMRAMPIQNSKQQWVFMHKEILGLPKSIETDHRNGYGLDNRKANLRPATHQQNQWNQQSHYKGTSQYKGVCWNKLSKKWVAYIELNGKQYHLGCFDNEIEAAKVYDRKAIEWFGEFARTNFKCI